MVLKPKGYGPTAILACTQYNTVGEIYIEYVRVFVELLYPF